MPCTYFIYAVFVFGALLAPLSDKAWKFSQVWISASMVLYVVGVGLSHGVLRPNVRRMQALVGEIVEAGPPPAGATGPPPQVAELEQRGRTVGIVGATLDVLLVVILVLMVWKPS